MKCTWKSSVKWRISSVVVAVCVVVLVEDTTNSGDVEVPVVTVDVPVVRFVV